MSRKVFGNISLLLWLVFFGPACAADKTAVKPPAQGTIRVAITFGSDGTVSDCHVVRSNAPFALEASTVDYVRKHWIWPAFAGSTEVVSLDFDSAPTPKYWEGEMAAPPDLYPEDGQTHNVTLRLTFGADGWVSSYAVTSPSGIDAGDQQTALWIKAHWHHDAYANRVIDAPFEFKPPAPKVVKPVAPAPPPEPVAIPAIRAQ
jgi:hypothetical protein